MLNLDYTFINNYTSYPSGLSKIYHKGQRHIWDGKSVLDELIEKHGLPDLTAEQRRSLIQILSLILWGEYAAWQTSAVLALELDDFEAKMAATSQTHDEARHFYVMCDYFNRVLKVRPEDLRVTLTTEVGLKTVMNASSLTRRLLGMQLMVEPVAITIFKALQESNIDPILTELLSLYIQDEARHIALGVRYLPVELKKTPWSRILRLFVWQSNLLKFEIDGLFELKEYFAQLGIDYLDVFEQAERRQIEAASEMLNILGWSIPIDVAIRKVARTYLDFKSW